MTQPSALIVNPSLVLQNTLDTELQAAFGSDVSCTRYIRPFDDSHPRMRPHQKPQFNLVVVDMTDWVEAQTASELLLRRQVPKWLQDDLLRLLSEAMIVILAPAKAWAAVELWAQRLPTRPAVFATGTRKELGDQVELGRLMHRMWAERNLAGRRSRIQNFLSYIGYYDDGS